MRWTVRGVSEDRVEQARKMAADMGGIGAVVDEAVRRLYESGDWPRKALPTEPTFDIAEFCQLFDAYSLLLRSLVEELVGSLPPAALPTEIREFLRRDPAQERLLPALGELVAA